MFSFLSFFFFLRKTLYKVIKNIGSLNKREDPIVLRLVLTVLHLNKTQNGLQTKMESFCWRNWQHRKDTTGPLCVLTPTEMTWLLECHHRISLTRINHLKPHKWEACCPNTLGPMTWTGRSQERSKYIHKTNNLSPYIQELLQVNVSTLFMTVIISILLWLCNQYL